MTPQVHRPRARDFLAQLCHDQRLDAILITDLDNVHYLTGFSGSEGSVIFSPKSSWFLSDFRYQEQAAREIAGFRIKIFRNKLKQIRRILAGLKVKRLGFEPAGLSCAIYQSLRQELKGARLIPLKKSPSQIRAVKDPDEIEKIAKAVTIAEAALAKALSNFRPGISELDFAAELEYRMRKAGSGWFAFETIIASGGRGALPHGTASHKRIKKGELVVIDFGAGFQGYHSDLTVTVAAGEPGKKARAIYAVVSEASRLAIAAVRPGLEARALDRVARDYIKAQGFGECFGHGLGHGLGLAVHEEPGINSRSKTVLEPGMVFTVEPGIYLPGKLGVRIEDDVLVENDRARVLSRSNRPLRILE